MAKRKVLVLGCTGEIGGRIARLCADAGHEVLGVSRGKSSRFTDLRGVKAMVGDKTDEAFLKGLDSAFRPHVVIDSTPWFGAVARYARCFPHVENIFFCGSTGKYVPLEFMPADETHQWRHDTKVNFFHQSQIDAEILDLYEKDGVPVTIFSPTNIIGEGTPPLELWGGRDIEFFRLLKAGKPVVIPPCLDVLVQSGYNWDLASAFTLAVNFPEAVRGEQFVISCKKAVTLGHYLGVALDYLKSTSDVIEVSCEDLVKLRKGVRVEHGLDFLMEHMCFDISKAEELLGYSPKLSTEEGLIRTLAWCEREKLL